MQRVISLILPKHEELIRTIKLYNQIVNYHLSKALEFKTISKKKLHLICYSMIRKKYSEFPSALIQCARDNAVEMLKGNKFSLGTKKRLNSSIRFDLRTFKMLLYSGTLNLTTIEGRKKYRIRIPEYFQKYKDWFVKGCTLGIDKKYLQL